MIYSTTRTHCTTWWDLSSELATTAASMAGRRCGSTALCRWKLRRLNQTRVQASTDYKETIARALVAWGGLVRWDNGDGGWRRSSGEAGRRRDAGEGYGGSNKRYAEHLQTTRKLVRALSWPRVVGLGLATATGVAEELRRGGVRG